MPINLANSAWDMPFSYINEVKRSDKVAIISPIF